MMTKKKAAKDSEVTKPETSMASIAPNNNTAPKA